MKIKITRSGGVENREADGWGVSWATKLLVLHNSKHDPVYATADYISAEVIEEGIYCQMCCKIEECNGASEGVSVCPAYEEGEEGEK